MSIDMTGVVVSGWHRKLWSEGIWQVWRTEKRIFLCGLVIPVAWRAVD